MPAHRAHREDPVPDHTTSASTITASATPASAVRVARIGGTIAELAAAAISAHTLFHLGRQLDLGPATAWLLPAALDVYAFTALAVGYNLPSHHPGQRIVLRNARLAFAMTLGANGLDHFLAKAGNLVDPTVRDLLLVTVATLPPLVVERLLNLQSLLVGNRAATGDRNGGELFEPPASGRAVGEGTLARSPDPAAQTAINRPRAEQPGATVSQSSTGPIQRPDWIFLGAEVFAALSAHLSRRPTAREFQTALASETRVLIAQGKLPAEARPPSVTTAKRIRAALEARPRRVDDTSTQPGPNEPSQTLGETVHE
jgi:hypothetical protein